MSDNENRNEALEAEGRHITAVESAADYIENFDILETITNVGNDEVFTPRKTCSMILDALPDEVWHNPDYKWLNPATKNGIFEREIALRLDNGLKDIIPDMETRRKHILQDMIFSIGQTRFTANVARRTLYYCSQANRKCDGIKAEDGHYVNGYAIGNGSWFSDEEGNIKTPNIGHTFVSDSGKPMPDNCKDEEKKKYGCKYCRINGASAYNDVNQRETYAYEFIHFDGKDLLKHLQDRFFGGDRNMKFDIIIGNPPYHLSDGGAGASAMPIYNTFVEQAMLLKPKYLSMIIPSRWFAGGRGLDNFRSMMMKNRQISKIYDFPKSRECFPTVDIAGGVCFFLWEREYTGPCEFVSIENGESDAGKRYLDEFSVILRNSFSISIVKKVLEKTSKIVSEVMLGVNPFGLRSYERGESKPFPSCCTLINSAGTGYILKEAVNKNQEAINCWKICIGYLNPDRAGVNNAADNKSNVITKIKILAPGEVVTETYIIPFYNENKDLVCNFATYLKTKLVRFLIYITLSSMHIAPQNFSFVPLIDMSKSWSDKDVYDYFGLSETEISFVEKKIRGMK